MNKKKIVVIGGGTGTYTVLTGLKKYPNLDLSVIVSMMDSGGSNRVLRDEFGLLPTSDIRQCLVALASDRSNEVLRKLFTYRYENGTGISGMTFGNLFMAALTDIYGNQSEAINVTSKMLGVTGKILPVTFVKTNLVARYENGTQVLGEHDIDEPDEDLSKFKIVELSVFPPAKANKDALAAIKEADLVVLGPGDLYTSILCNLVIDDMVLALDKSKAKAVYIMNLMTRFGQTTDFGARDHIREIEKYLGKGSIDCVLINNEKFSKEVLERYKEENAYPVQDDLNGFKKTNVIRTSLVGNSIFGKSKSDKLHRSLIRHDPTKVAKALVALL